MDAIFFANPSEFRQWLQENHTRIDELWVGYYKKATGIPSITWPESVDEALCFGWIDGLRKSIDDKRYRIRFTPRREGSQWSEINIRRVKALKKLDKMMPAGLTAFDKRKKENPSPDAIDRKNVKFSKSYEDALKANKKAWAFFNGLAPSFRQMSIAWVMSAKKEETRLRRLDVLIQSSGEGKKVPPLIISRKKRD